MLAIAGCNSLQSSDAEKKAQAAKVSPIAELKPLREPKAQLDIPTFTPENINMQTQYKPGPGVNITSTVADSQVRELSPNLTGQPLSANYHDMPLPVFINEVFGNQLGLSFSLDPQIQKQTDLVSLRVNDPIPPSELFRIAARTLSAYGVAISQQDNVYSFTVDKNVSGGETPLLISGRTLPDVPESHRPVFMFVQLKTVGNNKVASWVSSALQGKDIKVTEDAIRNAVMISGKPDVVRQALAIIDVLDQPFMRGKYSTSIEPAFTKASDLSRNLKDVLSAEGYDASLKSAPGSIIIIPLDGTNQLVVFAGSQAILDHVRDWVKTLDRRQQMSIDQGIFSYEVRNTEAGHIVELLNGIESGASPSSSSASMSRNATPQGSAVSDAVTTNSTSNRPSAGSISGGNFAVDTNRNTIVYKGSGQAWADLLPVIQSLDKSAPSVLIEMLIAEVSLNDSDSSGVELLTNGIVSNNGRVYDATVKTLGGLGIGKSGLTGTINSAGQTRAILNLFQQNKRAEIRSRPRLMVKSGQEATIDVGKEVPTRGSASTTGSSADFVVQNINNAKTGVRLAVKPVVHASGNIDIDIDQELSEATKTDTSSIDSPTIFNRKIKTIVTLRDGGSILLGGLISTNKSSTRSAVPKLGSIPLLGKLFRSDTGGTDRTELVVMIIPYVIETPTEGEAITKTIQDAFQKAE
ncbi:type II secretion system protein [Cellvibrio zantedeschiae]|uniref:Type II secretion system protein n=1 Tax=Cellvibrio zantedeschiae TaxID=1237077 RepID=A0ABQ3B6T1_9GAMM|nr:type II secretion system protein [Cellvibrio zantedeschiae]